MNCAPFLVGSVIAGTKILELVSEGVSMGATWYKVKYKCCGKEGDLSHTQIARRLSRDSKVCNDCARVFGGVKRETAYKRLKEPRVVVLPDYGVTPPTWAVPASISTGPWLWGR